jgi:hypothetical protein
MYLGRPKDKTLHNSQLRNLSSDKELRKNGRKGKERREAMMVLTGFVDICKPKI